MPTGESIFHVTVFLAHLKSAPVSQHVCASKARAKALGKCVAHPRLAQAKQKTIAQLLRKSLSLNQVNKQLDGAYVTDNS